MPSKGKKPSRTSSSAAVSCSPSPRTPLAPAREPRDDGGDEGLLRQLLLEASAKYPALVSESAFCGRISESDSSPSNGNRATVWFSEAAMVSSSLIPGSLVSVSLAALGKEPFNNFPLDNLAGEYVRHFGINVDDGMVNEAGCYFAIATVFPSRKVFKNGVKLSWGLSCTMGFPSMGRAIFVSSIDNLSSSHHLIKSASVTRIHVCKCKDLYLNMVQQNTGMVSGKELSTGDTSTESTCLQIGNGKVASPKTPSYQSMLSSPGATPSNSRKIDSFSFWNTSAAIMALEDEKFNDLLQTCTARWLSGRHLLNGNFATIPIDAQLCVFRVESADKLPAECSNQNFTSEGKYDLLPHESQISHSLDEMNVALLVDTKTKIHLSGLMYSVNKIPTEKDFPARGPISTAIRDKGACDIPRLGGLSKEFAALKEIIMFSLANENALPRSFLCILDEQGA